MDMWHNSRFTGLVVAGFAACGLAQAQTPPAQKTAPAAAPVANAVAVTVNGQPIYETSIQRALKRVQPVEQAKARPEIVEFLVDNMLVEQYLVSQKVAVDPQEVQKRIGEIQE